MQFDRSALGPPRAGRERFDGHEAVVEASRRADAAVQRGVPSLRRLSGGATQEIWRFDLVAGATRTPLILRRAPGGDRG